MKKPPASPFPFSRQLQTLLDKLNSQPFVFVLAYIILLIGVYLFARPLISDWGQGFWLALFILALLSDLIRYLTPKFIREKPALPLVEALQKEEQTDLPAKKSVAAYAPKDAETQYLQQIFNECRFVALGGIDTESSDPRQKSVELRRIYTDLLTTAKHDNGATSVAPPSSVSALKALDDHDRLVLLGGPGSGKSTLINFLSLCLSGDRLYGHHDRSWAELLRSHDCTWSHKRLLPLLIPLGDINLGEVFRDLAAPGNFQHLLSCIHLILESVGASNLISELDIYLRHGEAILLIDGLDEVTDPRGRIQVAEAIQDFAKQFHRCRYVVTCRQAAYPSGELEAHQMPWQLKGFKIAVLDNFDDERVRSFIQSWFKELSRIGRIGDLVAQNKAKALEEAIDQKQELQQIAGRPLLLTVMSIVHDKSGNLPDTRIELYEQCTEILLWRWETVKRGASVYADQTDPDILKSLGIQGLIYREDIERVLYKIVFDAHSKQNTRDELARVSARTFIESFIRTFTEGGLAQDEAYEKAKYFVDSYISQRAGLFIEERDNEYTTIHKSFQEYLSARHLCNERDFSRRTTELVQSGYEQWREVYLMAVGQTCRDHLTQAIDAVNRLYEEVSLLNQSGRKTEITILIGEALSIIGLSSVRKDSVGRRLLDEVRESFKDLVTDNQLSLQKRIEAGNLLGDIGDPRLKATVVQNKFNIILPELLTIPAGGFWMGSDREEKEAQPDEYAAATDYKPHWVELEDYQIGRFPVTETEFEMFIRSTGYTPVPKHWRNNRPPVGKLNHPVSNITWHDAMRYCKWVERALKELGKLPAGKQVRLPTEAEWEKAVRWDPSERIARVYPWGNEWEQGLCNTNEAGVSSTSTIGLFKNGKGRYGLQDGAGNVFEWCHSLVGDYPYCVSDGRENPDHEGFRIARGGSWHTTQRFARCAYRGRLNSIGQNSNFGFRIAIGAPLS
jgi:formylglycine-generating enzyme required for sulfatase activity